MEKKIKIMILGIAMTFVLAMSGCGVNHKTPEGVVESLIKEYTDGSEKKVKDCYVQKDDTSELLQNEIDATIKYFAAHNPTKINVMNAKYFPKMMHIRMCISFTILYWKMSRNIPALEHIW